MPMNAAIERAPREEIEALQRERLARRRSSASGARRSASATFTVKDDLREHYPLGLLAVPRVRAAPHPRVQRLARAPDRRRLHAARPRRLVGGDGALHGDGGRAARDGRPQRLRLRAVHRRARLPPGRRAARRADDPGLRRRDGAPGAAAARPAGPGAVLHAVLRAAHRAGAARGGDRRSTSSRWRSGCSAPSRGPRRCATQLEAELGPDRAERLRAVGDRRAGRVGRVPRGPRRPARAWRTTSWSRSSTPRPASRCRTATTASSCSRR